MNNMQICEEKLAIQAEIDELKQEFTTINEIVLFYCRSSLLIGFFAIFLVFVLARNKFVGK